MFLTPNIRSVFKRATLRREEREDGVVRTARCVFLIEPFLPWMAHELGEDIAEHLFENTADDSPIRSEITDVSFRLNVGLQRVTVRLHEDLAPVAALDGVVVEGLKVTRQEDEKAGRVWLSAAVTLDVALNGRQAIECVVRTFGEAACLSFTAMQALLAFAPDVTAH